MSHLNNCYNLPDTQILELWGECVPAIFSALDIEARALRSSVAISDVSHFSVLRLSGTNAYDVLNRIVPCYLNLRMNKIKQTIFIMEKSFRYADVYICKEASSYLLILKGDSPENFSEWIFKYKKANEEINIQLLNTTHSQIALNGPFAWELLAEIEDPEIISLPYLSYYYPDQNSIILRSGETGEFGYHLIYPHDTACRIWDTALEVGDDFDLERAGFNTLEYCSLENNFFNVRIEGSIGANPIELQLQWRISNDKQFVFDKLINEIRKNPLQRRLTAVFSMGVLNKDFKIYHENQNIGYIINANKFISGEGYIGLAMLDLPFAESGISKYKIFSPSGNYDMQTVSPPFVNNFSLVANPQIHSYAEKGDIPFPNLTGIPHE